MQNIRTGGNWGYDHVRAAATFSTGDPICIIIHVIKISIPPVYLTG